MNDWKFTHAPGLKVYGMNHGGEDRFSDYKYQSLAREVIQNSLDAKDTTLDSDKPVVVEFSIFSIPTENLPGVSFIRNKAIPNAKKFPKWINSEDTMEYLSDVEETLNLSEMKVLRMSDFGTTGLSNEQYDSLIGEGFSVKENNDSQGSKGIGKAAPFVNSKIRTIFYNSKSEKYGEKSVGIMHFLSFPFNLEDENDITESEGKFVGNGLNYIPEQTVFGDYTRENNGTDVFIMGFNDDDEKWKDKLIHSVIYNFMLSIYQEKIEVKIDDISINKQTLGKIIDELSEKNIKDREMKSQLLETKNFYKVVSEEVGKNKKIFTLDQCFLSEFPDIIENREDAELTILRDEDGNRKVLQTRNVGMRIYSRTHIEANVPYSAIFQAKGNKLNEFLKDMESAAHDNWTPNQKTIKKGKNSQAKDLLKALGQYFRNHIREEFGLVGKDGIKAFALGQFLSVKNEGEKNENSDSGIVKEISYTKIKKPKMDNKIINQKSDENILITSGLLITSNAEDSSISGLNEGNDFELGKGNSFELGKGNSFGLNEGNNFGLNGGNSFGLNEGNDFEVNEGHDFGGNSNELGKSRNTLKKNTTEKEKAFQQLKIKMLEVDYHVGQYKLVGRVNKKVGEVRIYTNVVGADGVSTTLEIAEAISAQNNVKYTSKYIEVYGLKKNDKINISFKINSAVRVKMDVIINEVKR